MMSAVAEVIKVAPSDDSASSGDDKKQPAAPASQTAQAPEQQSPMPPIAPPPPPPDAPPAAPKTIEKGQTKEVVVAILGQPSKVVKLGTKEIYYYPDMKVIFVSGKVTDVQ
jgi:hypothetical protein